MQSNMATFQKVRRWAICWTFFIQFYVTTSNLITSSRLRQYETIAILWLQTKVLHIFCRKKERDRDQHPYKVIEITPPPKNLGVRCFPSVSTQSFIFSFSIGFVFITDLNYVLCNSYKFTTIVVLLTVQRKSILFLAFYKRLINKIEMITNCNNSGLSCQEDKGIEIRR